MKDEGEGEERKKLRNQAVKLSPASKHRTRGFYDLPSSSCSSFHSHQIIPESTWFLVSTIQFSHSSSWVVFACEFLSNISRFQSQRNGCQFAAAEAAAVHLHNMGSAECAWMKERKRGRKKQRKLESFLLPSTLRQITLSPCGRERWTEMFEIRKESRKSDRGVDAEK